MALEQYNFSVTGMDSQLNFVAEVIATGPQGSAGPQGPQGIQGVAGATGPTGATGATGPAGNAASNLVTSVAGKQGVVTLVKGDVGLSNVDNTADTAKPVSTAQAAAISTAIANLVNSSPSTLDTLKELADALGDDPNYAATVTTALGLKAPLASPSLTGTPTAPTATAGTNNTQLATTAYVDAAAALVEASDVDSFNGRIGTVVSASGDYTAAQVTNSADKSSGSTQTFTGNLSAPNLTGTNTGDQTTITGNAGTATKLQTARTINGVSFDGSANISIPITDTDKLFGIASVIAQSASFTATANNKYTIDATAGNVVVTLPATNTINTVLMIQKSDATTNTVTMSGTINGNAGSNLALRTQLQGKLLQADGTGNWNIIAGDLSLPALDARYQATGSYQPTGNYTTRSINALAANTTGGTTTNVDYIYYWTGSTAYTFTLPSATGLTNKYAMVNGSTINQSFATTSSQTVNGSTTGVIIPGQSVEVIPAGTNWLII